MRTRREDHKVSGDNNSIILFMTLLLCYSGFDSVTKGYKGCGYDIKGIKGDTVYLFGLKQRFMSNKKYGYLFVEKKDFDSLRWAQQQNKNSKIFYVVFFSNNVLFISNDKGWSEKVFPCPTTTRFGNNEDVDKVVMIKDQRAPYVKRIDLNKKHLDDIKYIYGKPSLNIDECDDC